ncbi:unnamed protein product [marine sediment metagenome]|uniref:Uncharacterized protein n=1 Tax=marine sediment metagenome TaxID=412755 RepID=X0WV62_9ZZZZ
MATTTTAEKPTTLMDCEEYRNAWNRLQDLNAQLAGAKKLFYTHKSPSGTSLADAAEATAETGKVHLPSNNSDGDGGYSAQLQRVEVLGAAVEVQRLAVRETETAASHEICKGKETEFFAIGRELADALQSLRAILQKEYNFRHGLIDHGVKLKQPLKSLGVGADSGGGPHLEWHISEWFKENGDLL